MNRKLLLLVGYALATLFIISGIANAGSPMGTGFTYQGFLKDNSQPANAAYDFEFRLYDADVSGEHIGNVVTREEVIVSNGLFTVQLDFGSDAFNGEARWLEIGVRPGAETGAYTGLEPRQPLTPAPYALYASTAYTATNAITTTYAMNAGDANLLEGQPGSFYQARVSGACAIGSTIRSINADGTVACQTDAPLNRATAPTTNTINAVDNTGHGGSRSSVTIGTDGLGLITYGFSPANDLYVAHCNDLACTSVISSVLDTAGNVGGNPSIIIGADGLGLIAYRRTDNGDMKVAHCNNITCTSAMISIVAYSVASYDPAITIGGDGLGLLSYRNGLTNDLVVAQCSNLACTGAVATTLDSTGDVGYYTSIATGVDGLGLISYCRQDTGDLKVAHCDNPACTSATRTTLDSANDTGYYTSLVIGTDGRGLISYYDQTTGELRVAHCDDVACTSATFSTLDNVNVDGVYTSITIGADGLGVISYYDATYGVLKIAHCSDLLCTSATISQLDSVPGLPVGSAIGLTIGVDGLGLVSYYDYTNMNLKVAHCSNVFCAPYFRRR